jgi:hypothetical protein
MTRQCQARLLMVAIVALAGCSDPFAPNEVLELTTRATSYRAGELLELEVHNASGGTVLLGACPSGLYGVGDQSTPWVPYNHACPMPLYSLGSGQTLLLTWELPAMVAAGSYAVGVGFQLEESGRSGDARSHAIQITE